MTGQTKRSVFPPTSGPAAELYRRNTITSRPAGRRAVIAPRIGQTRLTVYRTKSEPWSVTICGREAAIIS